MSKDFNALMRVHGDSMKLESQDFLALALMLPPTDERRLNYERLVRARKDDIDRRAAIMKDIVDALERDAPKWESGL